MAKLTQSQLLALVEQLKLYDFDHFDLLLWRATGERLVHDAGSPQTPQKTLAKVVLDRANSTGYIKALLREILRESTSTPEIKTLILQAFPDLSIVNSPFQALVDAAVRVIEERHSSFPETSLPEVRTFLSALAQLDRYESLHAAIMRVPSTDMPLPPNADVEELDPFFDGVDLFLQQTGTALSKARSAFMIADVASVPQVAWIEGFDKSVRALQTARAERNAGATAWLLDDLAGQANMMLGYFNDVITATNGMLPFGDVFGVVDGQSEDDGARSINALRDALSICIRDYQSIQDVDRGLLRLERCLRAPPREAFITFNGAWVQTHKALDFLIMNAESLAWAKQARETAKYIEIALLGLEADVRNEVSEGHVRWKLGGPLDDLRQVVRRRFFAVGGVLKTHLAELDKLRHPLSQLGE